MCDPLYFAYAEAYWPGVVAIRVTSRADLNRLLPVQWSEPLCCFICGRVGYARHNELHDSPWKRHLGHQIVNQRLHELI
jgi:hypothetical protein